MPFEKGHKKSVGNKGGGRASAYEELQEAVWHSDKWEIDSDVPSLQAKLKTGKYSVRDVFLAKALQGNEKILAIFANKLLADLVDIRGKDGQSFFTLTPEEVENVRKIFPNEKDNS